jgi:hypothetical protein
VRKWAQSAAEDFARAAGVGDYRVAAGLISDGYANRLRARDRNPRPNTLEALLMEDFDVAPLKRYGNSYTWHAQANGQTITGAEVSPDGREVVCEGHYAMADGTQLRFRIRVGSDASSGKWRVESIVFIG